MRVPERRGGGSSLALGLTLEERNGEECRLAFTGSDAWCNNLAPLVGGAAVLLGCSLERSESFLEGIAGAALCRYNSAGTFS